MLTKIQVFYTLFLVLVFNDLDQSEFLLNDNCCSVRPMDQRKEGQRKEMEREDFVAYNVHSLGRHPVLFPAPQYQIGLVFRSKTCYNAVKYWYHTMAVKVVQWCGLAPATGQPCPR